MSSCINNKNIMLTTGCLTHHWMLYSWCLFLEFATLDSTFYSRGGIKYPRKNFSFLQCNNQKVSNFWYRIFPFIFRIFRRYIGRWNCKRKNINHTVLGSEWNRDYRILNVLNLILKVEFKIFQPLKWSWILRL